MRVIRYRVTIRRFNREGVFVGQDVNECVSIAGAAALITNNPPSTLSDRIQAKRDAKKGKEPTKPRRVRELSLEIGNARGWVEYEINMELPLLDLKEAIRYATDMHLGLYDDGEGVPMRKLPEPFRSPV